MGEVLSIAATIDSDFLRSSYNWDSPKDFQTLETKIKLYLTRQARYYKRNNEPRSCNYCCRGNAISITYSECLSVALVLHHAKLLSSMILSPVAWLALPPTFFHVISKWHYFREKMFLNIRCVFWYLYILCLKHFSFEIEITINVQRFSSTVPVILVTC
jgi:hypothetical protein